MRPADQIERLLTGLRDRTPASFDERTLRDMFAAQDRSTSGISARSWREIARAIMNSWITKLAAAAVLALAILLLARHLTGRERVVPLEWKKDIIARTPPSEGTAAPTTTVSPPGQLLLAQAEAAREYFAQADVPGLLQLLDTGQQQTQIVVAGYLAQLGEESALPVLEKLAAQWPGPAEDNPFRKSIEAIQATVSRPDETNSGNPVREEPPASPPQAAASSLTITVHVSDKATGAPIPNATVGTFASGMGERHTSDDNGVFVFDLGESVPGLVMISVSQGEYVGQIVSLRDLSGQKLPRTIEFSLEKGTVIGGVVQDAAGRPIQGARVESVIQEQQKFDQPCVHVSMKVTTDDRGRWRYTGMPAQIDRLWFNVYHPQFADGGFEMPTALKLDDLRAERAVMVLEEGIAVVGRVTDAAGNPIAGAELLAGESCRGRDWTKTDATGHFEFPHLRTINRSFLLTVQAKGFAPQRQELPSQKNLAPVQFVLQPAVLLVGRVVDSAGHPVEGVYVAAERWNRYRTVRWSSKTDAQGTFVWDSAPADAIEIRIEKDGYRQIVQDVVADGQKHPFILVRPMTIRGSVTDSQTGQPISRFRLTPGLGGARGGLAKWQPSDDWARWFTDGRYSFTFDADAEAYGVRIEAEGYAPVESRFVDANETGATIDIVLTKGEGPSGYVFDTEARPVAGARVFWARYANIQNGQVSNADSLAHTTTGSDGRFVFPADNRTDPLFALCDQGMGIVSWEEFTKTGAITLLAWARVQGDLRIGRQPGIGRTLQLIWYNRLIPGNFTTRGETTTDENGRFVFERVFPGDFVLYHRTYQALPGQTLELHLGGTGRTVTGRLMLAGLANTPLSTTLVVRPKVEIPFDQLAKPPGYGQMSLDEFRAWLDQWNKSQEGQAYRAWLTGTYP